MHDTSTTNIVNEANRMRKMVPERFYEMVVMHLSILLDLNGVLLSELETSLSQTSVGKTPSSSGRHSKSASRKPIKEPAPSTTIFGEPLTFTSLKAILPLIEFLDENVNTKGLFRIGGNLKRMSDLMNRLNTGEQLTLAVVRSEYNVHVVASLVKRFLEMLPERVLCDSLYDTYLSINELPAEKRLTSMQLLAQLLPRTNYHLLSVLLPVLKRTTDCIDQSQMSVSSMATVMLPSVLVPRHQRPAHELMNKAAQCTMQFFIEQADNILKIPERLKEDIRAFWRKTEEEFTENDDAVATNLTFNDRVASQSLGENLTAISIMELVNHIKEMPDSHFKRNTIKRLKYNCDYSRSPRRISVKIFRKYVSRKRKECDHTTNIENVNQDYNRVHEVPITPPTAMADLEEEPSPAAAPTSSSDQPPNYRPPSPPHSFSNTPPLVTTPRRPLMPLCSPNSSPKTSSLTRYKGILKRPECRAFKTILPRRLNLDALN